MFIDRKFTVSHFVLNERKRLKIYKRSVVV